ncbi:recombinase RecT, partial [Vibrio owensii]|uniref:recombinase RecT n=1 Tax=Vibrio owensii TaxID=696485 RepID=UPI0038CDF328
EVSFICADVVFPEDRFEYYVDEEGTHLLHVPDFEADRSVDRIKLFFAMARLKSGEVKAAVMTRKDVDRVRAASTGKNSDAWRQWYDRMGLKSVGHRLCRDLPRGDELLAMLEKNNEMSWNDQAWQEQQWNGEIDITPSYDEAVKHGHTPVNAEMVEVEELMGAESYTFEQAEPQQPDYEPPQYDEPDIDQLMSADEQVDDVYAQLESAVFEIGDTNDRQRTIEQYKYAVGAVNNAVRVNAITQEQANLLSQQLTTIYQAINSEL